MKKVTVILMFVFAAFSLGAADGATPTLAKRKYALRSSGGPWRPEDCVPRVSAPLLSVVSMQTDASSSNKSIIGPVRKEKLTRSRRRSKHLYHKKKEQGIEMQSLTYAKLAAANQARYTLWQAESDFEVDASVVQNHPDYKVILHGAILDLYQTQLQDEAACKKEVVFENVTLENWLNVCNSLPINKQWLRVEVVPQTSILMKFSDIADRQQACAAFFKQVEKFIYYQQKVLADSNYQMSHTEEDVADILLWSASEVSQVRQRKFIQRLDLKVTDEVCFFADRHGDIHSMVKSLELKREQGWFKGNSWELQDDKYMIFLGDYVDRGMYGESVLLTILKLQEANPRKVFLVRGNHEDYNLNALPLACSGGFLHEIHQKLLSKYVSGCYDENVIRAFVDMYDRMPEVILVGCNGIYMHACHGGIEDTLDLNPLLDAKSKASIVFDWERPNKSGQFVHKDRNRWADFCVDSNKSSCNLDSSRCEWSRLDTLAYLKKHPRIAFVVRGHQHTPELMPKLKASCGAYDMWSNVPQISERGVAEDLCVTTLNIASDGALGVIYDFNFDTCMVVKMHEDSKQWIRRIDNPIVYDHAFENIFYDRALFSLKDKLLADETVSKKLLAYVARKIEEKTEAKRKAEGVDIAGLFSDDVL